MIIFILYRHHWHATIRGSRDPGRPQLDSLRLTPNQKDIQITFETYHASLQSYSISPIKRRKSKGSLHPNLTSTQTLNMWMGNSGCHAFWIKGAHQHAIYQIVYVLLSIEDRDCTFHLSDFNGHGISMGHYYVGQESHRSFWEVMPCLQQPIGPGCSNVCFRNHVSKTL